MLYKFVKTAIYTLKKFIQKNGLQNFRFANRFLLLTIFIVNGYKNLKEL
jgi:hypothetical protein